MNARAASLSAAELSEHEKAMDLKIAGLEASRDLSHIWVCVDMDAFYAAVETLGNPSLAGKPMAVGGMSMICTANYEARKFGVRAAMPGFIARKLCPDLIFVRPDFKKYSHYSELSRQVFKEYDPDFLPRSLDEAFLDISTPCRLRNMCAAEVAEVLRSKVHLATGLTCSAGVGPNQLLAKVCSDIKKPNGQFVLGHEREAIMAFVSALPIRKINGIGKVTERLLKEVLGISTCADLLRKRAFISALFSNISSEFLVSAALGIGGSKTPQKEPRKSLSNERTFAAISDEHKLFQKLAELVDLLVDDMQKEDLQGRTLTLKLTETGFEVRSRAVTLPSFISTREEIWEHASKLLKGELPLSLRLMGLRISHFKGENADPAQRTLGSFFTGPGAVTIDQTTPVSNLRKSDLKDENADPAQRTLRSFVTRPGAVTIDQTTPLSNELTNDGFSLSDKANDMHCGACPGDTVIPEDSRAMKRKGTLEEGFDSSAVEEDIDGLSKQFNQSTSSGLRQETVGLRKTWDPTMTPEAVGRSWETLQSGYDSGHEQVWKDNQCTLCDVKVNYCLPSARQEHEDFHYATWVAQPREESSDFQTSTSPSQAPVKKVDRIGVGRELKKRNGPRANFNLPHKKISHLLIETFFSKAK